MTYPIDNRWLPVVARVCHWPLCPLSPEALDKLDAPMTAESRRIAACLLCCGRYVQDQLDKQIAARRSVVA